jgi:hypothetical protein
MNLEKLLIESNINKNSQLTLNDLTLFLKKINPNLEDK